MLKYCSGVRLSFVLAISSAYTGTEAHADASCFGFLFFFSAGMRLWSIA